MQPFHAIPVAVGLDRNPLDTFSENTRKAVENICKGLSIQEQRAIIAKAFCPGSKNLRVYEMLGWVTAFEGREREVQRKEAYDRLHNMQKQSPAFSVAWRRIKDGAQFQDINDIAHLMHVSAKPLAFQKYRDILEISLEEAKGDPRILSVQQKAAGDIAFGKHNPRTADNIGNVNIEGGQTQINIYQTIVDAVHERRKELAENGMVIEGNSEVIDADTKRDEVQGQEDWENNRSQAGLQEREGDRDEEVEESYAKTI